jgi:hypothetical protein
MAFDASNNKADTNQVVSSTPLAGGQQPPAQQQQKDSQPVQATSQPANVQSGTSTEVQSQQNQQQSQQNTKKPSSGMFTNIQKYVQKNKPQAQKMASAVSTDVSNQAQEIGSQVQDKQQQMNQALRANQQNLDTQMDQAREYVAEASGMEYDQNTGWNYDPNAIPEGEDPYALTDEQESQYQQFMEGPVGVSQVGGLNISEQQQRAEALQQLASQTNTESGRRSLLGESFRDDGDYTSGMAGLDDLIVTGDPTAREQMIQGVQQQANELQSQIETIGSEANKAKMAQDLAMRNFGTDVSNLSQEAIDQIMSQVNTRVNELTTNLEGQLENLSDSAISQFDQALRYKDATDFYNALLGTFDPSRHGNKKGRHRDYQDYWSVKAMMDPNINLIDFLEKQNMAGWMRDTNLDPNKYITLGAGGKTRLDSLFENLIQDAGNYGLDVNSYRQRISPLAQSIRRGDLYGKHWHAGGNKVSGTYAYEADKFNQVVTDIFKDIENKKQEALQRNLKYKYGLDDDQVQEFLDAKSINAAGVATADQAARIEALRNLTGSQTDALGTELGEDAGIGSDTEFLLKLIRDYGLDPEDFGL